jgi:hypothetical protein
VTDSEAERVVARWVELADRVVGVTGEEGRCDGCGSRGYISKDGGRRLCARCLLEGEGRSAA